MSKYIELIDKYVIEQRNPSEMSEYGSDMNPPNYIWTDNTGVRSSGVKIATTGTRITGYTIPLLAVNGQTQK